MGFLTRVGLGYANNTTGRANSLVYEFHVGGQATPTSDITFSFNGAVIVTGVPQVSTGRYGFGIRYGGHLGPLFGARSIFDLVFTTGLSFEFLTVDSPTQSFAIFEMTIPVNIYFNFLATRSLRLGPYLQSAFGLSLACFGNSAACSALPIGGLEAPRFGLGFSLERVW